MGHSGEPGEIGAYGRAGIDDGSLSSYGPAESDGDRTRKYGRPHVVGLDPGFVAGYRLQDLGHSMADIVLDHEAEKEQRDEHTDTRQDQVQQRMCRSCESRGQEPLYEMDEFEEDDGGKAAGDAYQQREYQELVALLHVPEQCQQPVKHTQRKKAVHMDDP